MKAKTVVIAFRVSPDDADEIKTMVRKHLKKKGYKLYVKDEN